MSVETDKRPWWSWWSVKYAHEHLAAKIVLGIVAGIICTFLALR